MSVSTLITNMFSSVGIVTVGVIIARGYLDGWLPLRSSPPYQRCEKCGRDKNAVYHEGFNGYFIDENLTCK